MSLPPLWLAAAVLLLWIPRVWLRAGPRFGRRRRGRRLAHSWTHAPQDGTVLSFGHEFSRLRNYLDFLRAGLGTILLVGSNGVEGAIAGIVEDRGTRLGCEIGILCGGVLIQSLRLERREMAFAAPVFYVGGLLSGLHLPLAGLAAFAVAWALVPVIPRSQGFLTVLGAAFGVVGLFLHGLDLRVIVGAALCLLPVVLSLLAKRPLLVFSQRR